MRPTRLYEAEVLRRPPDWTYEGSIGEELLAAALLSAAVAAVLVAATWPVLVAAVLAAAVVAYVAGRVQLRRSRRTCEVCIPATDVCLRA